MAWEPSVHRVVGRTGEEGPDPWEGRLFWVPEPVAEEDRWWKKFLRLVKAIRPDFPVSAGRDGFLKEVMINPDGQDGKTKQ